MIELQAREPTQPRQCPLCRDALDDAARTCPGCETAYHGECLRELGGCSTLGCRLAGELPESSPHWFCRACHGPIERELQRRNCRCRAALHDRCVEDHAAVCEHAAELRRATGTPAARPKLATPPWWRLSNLEWQILACLLTFFVFGLAVNLQTDAPGTQLLPRDHGTARSPAPIATWSVEELVEMARGQGATGPAVRELQRRGSRALPDLLLELRLDDPDNARIKALIEQVLGEPFDELVHVTCEEPDPGLRRVGIESLPYMQDPDRAQALATAACADPDPELRRVAQETLNLLQHMHPRPAQPD